jgi:uncharacterized repeat protein (TIGR01451 family)
MRRRLSLLLLCNSTILLLASPAFASFHFMKVEEAIGGVGGDTSQQAIQLRMRSAFQHLVGSARLIAWDAAGLNPVTLIIFPSNVANAAQGARILVVSPAFASAYPGIPADFTTTSLIPSSYLPAGRLTFEDSVGTIYWSLAWGGAGYTGSTSGSLTNDADGDFGPPFGSALPSTTNRALLFTAPDATGDALSTTNLADYGLTTGAAVFTNNAGTSGTLPAPPQADLSITKTDGQASAVPGSPIQYTIVVSNAGPSGVTAATVADTVPAEITGASFTCSGTGGGFCTPVGSGNINDTVNLPAGATVTYFLTGTISASARGSLSNTATVTAPNGITDPNPANNSATDTDILPGVDFFTVAPCRAVDTRGGAPLGGPVLQGQETRVFTVAGLCGISSTAKAVSINLTVTESTSAGNVRLFPAGQTVPNISTINYAAGQTRANNAIVSLDFSGGMAAFAGQPAGTTVHVIIDVNGYFE